MNNVRYAGSVPVMFSDPDREVFPGDVFSVSDGRLESYLLREDIELAPEPAPASETITDTVKTRVKEKTAD